MGAASMRRRLAPSAICALSAAMAPSAARALAAALDVFWACAGGRATPVPPPVPPPAPRRGCSWPSQKRPPPEKAPCLVSTLAANPPFARAAAASGGSYLAEGCSGPLLGLFCSVPKLRPRTPEPDVALMSACASLPGAAGPCRITPQHCHQPACRGQACVNTRYKHCGKLKSWIVLESGFHCGMACSNHSTRA